MAKLFYFNAYVAGWLHRGETDSMDWSAPSEEVSAFINDRHCPSAPISMDERNMRL